MIFDNAHQPLSPQAVIGRRAVRYLPDEEAWGPPGRVKEVKMSEDGPTHLVLCYEDPRVPYDLVPLTEVMIPAVTDLMLEMGAEALLRSYRRQADPAKAEEQRRTAEKHARLVLEAAIEGRRHDATGDLL